MNNPLTPEHCACLNKVLEQSGPAIDLAKACKECGLDSDEYLNQLTAQKDMATKLKAKFFPNIP